MEFFEDVHGQFTLFGTAIILGKVKHVRALTVRKAKYVLGVMNYQKDLLLSICKQFSIVVLTYASYKSKNVSLRT